MNEQKLKPITMKETREETYKKEVTIIIVGSDQFPCFELMIGKEQLCIVDSKDKADLIKRLYESQQSSIAKTETDTGKLVDMPELRQNYHLNCDKCGKTYWSQEGFPKPQLCYDCSDDSFVKSHEQEKPQTDNVFLIHQDGNIIRLYKNGVKISPSEFTEFYGCEITDEQKKLLEIAKQNYFDATQKHIPTDELQEFMNDVHKWADDTFGKERTAKAPLYHLKKEVDEAVKAMEQGIRENTLTELADCFILILNASSKYRMTFKELLEASKEKMIINKSRKWGKPDRNGVVEHDRSETEPAKELTEPGFVRSGDAPHEIIWQGVEYVKKSEDNTCDSCGCHPSVIIVTTKGRFCQDHVRY